MGGLAFANVVTDNGKPPHVPRLSPDLYEQISADCQSKLATLFQRVVIPRDAPAKTDFGDIDFLVAGIQHSASKQDIWDAIKDVLDAPLHLHRGESHSFAIKHPQIEGAYVQVDVELCPGDGTPDVAELFEWTRFMKGDSDLLQILGISHRPLGLTCNDRGFYVRVEEIETYDKKKALLFLTRDPNEAIEFYGLDRARYWTGFKDENDLFDWASSGRFFSQSLFEGRTEKSNDRSRLAKRPMYRRFVEEYMPARPDTGTANTWTRQEVLHKALDRFDKHAEYNSMMEAHRQKEDEEKLWQDIRAAISAEGYSLSLALKGLRRWVEFQDGKPRIAANPNLDEYSRWIGHIAANDRDEVLAWVRDNWREVKALEKGRANQAKEAAKRAQ